MILRNNNNKLDSQSKFKLSPNHPNLLELVYIKFNTINSLNL